MPTMWNPSDTHSTVGLANNNLTAIVPTPSGQRSTRSTTSKRTGKWYYECRASWLLNSRIVGIMTKNHILTSFPGFNASGYGLTFFGAQWQVYHTNSATNYGGSASSGDIIGLCLDLDNHLLYFTQNGANLVGDVGAGTGGTTVVDGTANPDDSWFAAVGGAQSTADLTITANFGATPFSFGPPSGYSAWDSTPFFYNSFESPTVSIVRTSYGVGT